MKNYKKTLFPLFTAGMLYASIASAQANIITDEKVETNEASDTVPSNAEISSRDYQPGGKKKRTSLIFLADEPRFWIDARVTGEANAITTEFWQNYQMVHSNILHTPNNQGDLNERGISLPSKPGQYGINTHAASYNIESNTAVPLKLIDDPYKVRIVNVLPHLESFLPPDEKIWLHTRTGDITVNYHIYDWIDDLNDVLDSAWVDVVDSGSFNKRYSVAMPQNRDVTFSPTLLLPANFWIQGACRTFRAGLDYGNNRTRISRDQIYCYDGRAPQINWAGDNLAGETRQVKSGRVTVAVDGIDADSGVKSATLRYAPYRASPPVWQEVELTRSGKLWQAELQLNQPGIKYELQAKMVDVAGNISNWTEAKQATYIAVDGAVMNDAHSAAVANIPQGNALNVSKIVADEDICYDDQPPEVEWAGNNRAGKLHWTRSKLTPLIVTVNASDIDSGISSGKLRYATQQEKPQQWKEVALTRDATQVPEEGQNPGEGQWHATLTLDHDEEPYEVQVEMTDINGNRSSWTEGQQSTYVATDNTPPNGDWKGGITANTVTQVDGPQVKFIIDAQDKGTGMKSVTVEYVRKNFPLPWTPVELALVGETMNGFKRYEATVTLEKNFTYELRHKLTDNIGNATDWSESAIIYVKK